MYVYMCEVNDHQRRYDTQSHRDRVSELPTGYSWLLLTCEVRVLNL